MNKVKTLLAELHDHAVEMFKLRCDLREEFERIDNEHMVDLHTADSVALYTLTDREHSTLHNAFPDRAAQYKPSNDVYVKMTAQEAYIKSLEERIAKLEVPRTKMVKSFLMPNGQILRG